MSDDKNKWAAPPEDEDDEDLVTDDEIEKEATDAAMATVELFQNFDLDEPETVPATRTHPDAVPAQNDELAVNDEPAGMKQRIGSGFSRGLFWMVGLAFALMIGAAIGVVWMIFNILAKLA